MLLPRINDLINVSMDISDTLNKGGLIQASKGVDDFVRILNVISSLSEEEAIKKIANKHYKNEIERYYSIASHVKGFKDMCPNNISYEDWRVKVSQLEDSIYNVRCFYKKKE